MKAELAQQLVVFNDDAKKKLRTGSLPDDEWLTSKLAFLHRHCSFEVLSKETDENHQRMGLEALRRIADLADRMGRHDEARPLLSDHVAWILIELEKAITTPRGINCDRLSEAMWVMILYSVCEHRASKVEDAVSHLQQIELALQKCNFPEADYLLLYHRVSYALGRHNQSLKGSGKMAVSENYYTDSLGYCVKYCDRHPAEKAYASYRMSVTMIGLARLFIDRGELGRGFRELSVVRLLLKDTPDVLTSAFVDLSLAQVHRQRGRLTEAITLLEKALIVFEQKNHHRHYIFCRHELAKAKLNDGNFAGALATLLDESDFAVAAQQKSAARWLINDQILGARIQFEQEQHNALQAKRKSNPDELTRIKGEIAGAMQRLSNAAVKSPAITAQGLIIRGEIEIALERPQVVEKLLQPVTHKNIGPLDVTDEGWAWLVVAQAHLNLNNVDAAFDAINHYQNLRLPVENIFFSEREKLLSREIALRSADGLWFPPNQPIKPWAAYEKTLKAWIMKECRARHKDKKDQRAALEVTTHIWKGLESDCPEVIALPKGDEAGPKSKGKKRN